MTNEEKILNSPILQWLRNDHSIADGGYIRNYPYKYLIRYVVKTIPEFLDFDVVNVKLPHEYNILSRPAAHDFDTIIDKLVKVYKDKFKNTGYLKKIEDPNDLYENTFIKPEKVRKLVELYHTSKSLYLSALHKYKDKTVFIYENEVYVIDSNLTQSELQELMDYQSLIERLNPLNNFKIYDPTHYIRFSVDKDTKEPTIDYFEFISSKDSVRDVEKDFVTEVNIKDWDEFKLVKNIDQTYSELSAGYDNNLNFDFHYDKKNDRLFCVLHDARKLSQFNNNFTMRSMFYDAFKGLGDGNKVLMTGNLTSDDKYNDSYRDVFNRIRKRKNIKGMLPKSIDSEFEILYMRYNNDEHVDFLKSLRDLFIKEAPDLHILIGKDRWMLIESNSEDEIKSYETLINIYDQLLSNFNGNEVGSIIFEVDPYVDKINLKLDNLYLYATDRKFHDEDRYDSIDQYLDKHFDGDFYSVVTNDWMVL